MYRTITLSVMWQINPLTGEATDPTLAYRSGGINCFVGQSMTTLVECEPGVFVGHVDFDRSTGDEQHLGVFSGTPTEVANQLKQAYVRLNAARKDGLGDPAEPAEMVIWLREFKPDGGPEAAAIQLLWWIHPATR